MTKMPNNCRHLGTRPGWRYEPQLDGEMKETEIVGFECQHMDNNPSQYLNLPRWVQTHAMHAITFDEKKHCVGCAAYDAKRADE